MSNKKGGIDIYITLMPSLVLFILTLFIFSIIFFATNLTKSPNLIIKSESYHDNSKIIILLKSKTDLQQNQANLTIAELISLANKDEKYKEELIKNLNNIIKKLPVPEKEFSSNLQKADWNLDIDINQEKFLHLGENSVLSTIYFNQTTIIPLSNKETAKVTLYLECFSCLQEGIDSIA